jgi:chitin disaccharide deacetylase
MPVRVTADDFGIGYETSRGIVEAHLAGPVSATSVMVVAAEQLKRSLPLLNRAPGLRLGLHVTLTANPGMPLRARKRSGLVNRRGEFASLGILLARCVLRRVDRSALRDEISGQVELFQKLVGRAPEYVDGHQHCHQFAVVRDVVAELIDAGVLPRAVRCTPEPPAVRRGIRVERSRRSLIHAVGVKSRPVFAAVGGIMPDYFVGVLSPAMLRLENPWEPYVRLLPARAEVELGVHPGRLDESLRGRDPYIQPREAELQALLRVGADGIGVRRM